MEIALGQEESVTAERDLILSGFLARERIHVVDAARAVGWSPLDERLEPQSGDEWGALRLGRSA